MTLFGGIAVFVLGFVVLLVILLVIGQRALAASKAKGVVISDGISRSEAKTIAGEIMRQLDESGINPEELLDLLRVMASRRAEVRKVESAQRAAALASALAQDTMQATMNPSQVGP